MSATHAWQRSARSADKSPIKGPFLAVEAAALQIFVDDDVIDAFDLVRGYVLTIGYR